MTAHLTARLTWHEGAWNGRICTHPLLNAACMMHEHVRDARRDLIEQAHCGKAFADVSSETGYMPPCQRDANAFGEQRYVVTHHDPLEGRALPSAEEEVLPYSCCPTPYRWMLEGNFREICEDENLQIPGRRNPESQSTWVMEDDRQRALLSRFWGKVEKGKSLIFYYCNRGNAADETVNRLIVGASRISEIGNPVYFGKRTDRPGNFPVWSRQVTSMMPRQGVRIPYQEYLAAGKDVSEILCTPPRSLSLPFSYVAEHLSDGQAVSAILEILKSIARVREDGFVAGNWDEAIAWCNGVLDELWSGRGAYPGIGAVLRYLGCSQGIDFHATVLLDIEKKGQDPWEFVINILEGRVDPPSGQYFDGLLLAKKTWRSMPSRHRLLNTLVRFELTTDQVTGVANEDKRKERGIAARADVIIENPYVLFEQDKGDEMSEPIGLETIDQGMLPEGDAALFSDEMMSPTDHRRIRATTCAVLRTAADAGDTLLPFDTLIGRIHDWYPEQRQCLADREVFWSGEDRTFHNAILWLKEDAIPEDWRPGGIGSGQSDDVSAENDDDLIEDLGADEEGEDQSDTIKLVALKSVRRQEVAIAKVVETARPLDDIDTSPPDWGELLTRPVEQGGFGKPRSDRERVAINEKISALQTLFGQRISVLTGGAGTGKTSVLKAFLRALHAVEGRAATLLAAPTGKARVRLESATGLPANTIHQKLYDAGMLGPNYQILEEPQKGILRFQNVIVDECSMLSVELLAALFRAIDVNAIRRLVFVGDPYQLPPIGPGRPFSDIIRWMRANSPECVAELETCMRVAETGDGKATFSKGLELASGYRDEAGPADDAVLSELVRSGELVDVRVRFWADHEQLLKQLYEELKQDFGIEGGVVEAFDTSLGIQQGDWNLSEQWQILSATRIQPFGTDELNRVIQDRFRGELLSQARDFQSKWPSPFGNQEIVYHDKVIQTVNAKKWLPKGSDGLGFVANGEIGVVTKAWKGKGGKPDNLYVAFSTQPKAEYRFTRGEAKETLELAYALTVHKSQGSDFETVILVVPQRAQTLSRELLYTALTRFRKKLILLVERDSKPLLNLRYPGASDTMRRTTRMFELLLGQDLGDLGLKPRYRPAGLIHRTSDGTYVRSKSEVIVYDVLASLGLSIEYETPLIAKSGEEADFRLPDFTIHRQGRTWYWEHLGMLDKASYRSDWEKKKSWYKANGFWDRVVTSEDHPGGLGGIVYADEIREIAKSRILAAD